MTYNVSMGTLIPIHSLTCPQYGMVWYGILGFNVPLDTVKVISETGGPEQ